MGHTNDKMITFLLILLLNWFKYGIPTVISTELLKINLCKGVTPIIEEFIVHALDITLQ